MHIEDALLMRYQWGAHNEAAQKCDIHTCIPALYNNTFSEIALTLPLKGKWEEQDGRATLVT